MSSNLEAKLAKLKRLHEMGLLTDAAYQQQQSALVAEAMGTTPTASPALSLAGATRLDGSESNSRPSPFMPAMRAPASASSPLSGHTTIDSTLHAPKKVGNYRVLGPIGTGGMGSVVRARHEEEGWAQRQGGDVALKLIHTHRPALQQTQN